MLCCITRSVCHHLYLHVVMWDRSDQCTTGLLLCAENKSLPDPQGSTKQLTWFWCCAGSKLCKLQTAKKKNNHLAF